MRVFFALMPEVATVAALAHAAAPLPEIRGRPVPRSNYHVTLVFVGQVDAAGLAACIAAGGRVDGRAFTLDFTSAGSFPRARVGWLAPTHTPAALATLVADLRSALAAAGVGHDPKPFRCHLTIARDICGPLAAQAVSPVAWPVREFALVESLSDTAGVRYEIRARWLLRPACRDETAPPPVQ